MDTHTPIRVTGPDGLRGFLDAAPDGDGPVLLRLESGERLVAPAAALSREPDGSYRLSVGADLLRRPEGEAFGVHEERGVHGAAGLREAARVRVPVVEETLAVGTRTVETGRVRVEKRTEEREEAVRVPLVREEVEVRRVPVGRVVDGPVAVRTEGDTTIVPVLEEVLVVEKRLVLREEIHLTRRRDAREQVEHVRLRREEADVTRTPEGAPSIPRE